MKRQIEEFIKNNKIKVLVIFIINLIVNINIGLVNYPYIDDILRQRQGIANFIAHYARYFSEYASWTFQGNRHLTDMGLTTHILSAIIMSLTACVVLYILNSNKYISWSSTIASIIIGINPWFLEVLSFRFDSPYICLSVLVSVMPYIFLKNDKKLLFFLTSVFAIILMCNSYQASSGIYIITLLSIIFLNLIQGKPFLGEIKSTVIAAMAYTTGMLFYLIQMRFNPQLLERGDHTKISSLNKLVPTMAENLTVFKDTVRNQLANVWLYLIIIALIILILQSINVREKKFLKHLLYTSFYLVMGFIFSYGVYIAVSTTLADDRPRYIYGFGFLLSLVLIISGILHISSKIKILRITAVTLLVYYLFSFSLTYASTLSYQKNEFENQSILLADDLSDVGTEAVTTVYINKFLKNSVVYENTKINYPILDDLVPNNELLYWPNFLWFNSITHLDINFQPKDTSDLGEEYQLVLSKKFYDIFKKDDELFIHMK